MATNKNAKQTSAKTSSSELLKEERRLARELKTRLKAIENKANVDVATNVARRQVSGFVDFIREQSVVGLAVGLVLGTQLKQLVDSIVANFISPLLALIMPGKDALEDKAFVIHAFGKASQPFGWGKVLLTFISFVAVALLVYAVFKILRLDKLAKKQDEPKEEKKGKKSAKAKTSGKKSAAKETK